MRVAIVAVLLALAGCANYRISGSTGTTVASGGSGAYVATTSTSGALFFALMFGAMASSQEASVEAAPAMSAARSINEQDCTRPVSLTGGGNLRCR